MGWDWLSGEARGLLEGEQGPGSGSSFLPCRALPWDEMVPPACGNQALWIECPVGTPSREWSQTTGHKNISLKPSLPLSDVQEHGSILYLQNVPEY